MMGNYDYVCRYLQHNKINFLPSGIFSNLTNLELLWVYSHWYFCQANNLFQVQVFVSSAKCSGLAFRLFLDTEPYRQSNQLIHTHRVNLFNLQGSFLECNSAASCSNILQSVKSDNLVSCCCCLFVCFFNSEK